MQKLKKKPWFWFLLFLFLGHQFLEKGLAIHFVLADAYLDDLLCLPILLYGWQAEQNDLFGRQWLYLLEVILIFAGVGLLFEFILPSYSPSYVGDAWDWFCYLLGAGFFVYLERRQIRVWIPLRQRSM